VFNGLAKNAWIRSAMHGSIGTPFAYSDCADVIGHVIGKDTKGDFWMDKSMNTTRKVSAQPHFHQRAEPIQRYGTVTHARPLDLEEPVRLEMTERLNELLADTMTIRDLYKKSHWQVAGATFYQLHLLFDQHYDKQVELVDSIAERIQLLGGVSLAMGADVAETTRIDRPPRDREEVPAQLSRLLDAHKVIIGQARSLARRASQLADEGTNDLAVSEVLRANELQTWFLSEHLVRVPLVTADDPSRVDRADLL
jgi:starvation-inducible DNA-binding protein